MEGIIETCYNYNQRFTNEPNFGINYPIESRYAFKQMNQPKQLLLKSRSLIVMTFS